MAGIKTLLLIFAAGATTLAGAQAPETQANTTPAAASVAQIKPFSAAYAVQWHGINVGTSELEFKSPNARGEYEYLSRSNARGIFRVVFSEQITQNSLMTLHEGHARPLSYRADDGTSSTDQDVSLDFDWVNDRVRGTAEKKPVDLALKPDTQDPMSVQIELMLALMRGHAPTTVWLADKDEIKEFIYTNEGPAHIKVALGELDTVVLASKRPGGNRVTRLWFAPSLGFTPVQAQRTRDGKTEWTMTIKSLQRGAAPPAPPPRRSFAPPARPAGQVAMLRSWAG